jgi:hypothetical protein
MTSPAEAFADEKQSRVLRATVMSGHDWNNAAVEITIPADRARPFSN